MIYQQLEQVIGLPPLSEENQKAFQRIWRWFVDNHLTSKPQPQVTSGGDTSYHLNGLIGINENHRNEIFPLPAVILEETLHWVLSSDDPKTSADFSHEFLQGIRRFIAVPLDGRPEECTREFQSMLIRTLWEQIERDSC